MRAGIKICDMILDLEYIIAHECYNPYTYNGWRNMDGRSFRYPVMVPDEKGVYEINRRNKIDRLSPIVKGELPASIMFMKYKFGSNELFIGKGLIKVLAYLERRYGIDFNALEEARQKK